MDVFHVILMATAEMIVFAIRAVPKVGVFCT